MFDAFESIIKVCFEPIALAAIIGLFLWARKNCKLQHNLVWFVLTVIFVAVFWRVFIIKITTHRYAEILLFPVICFVAYGCRHVFSLFSKNEKYIKIAGWICIVLLCAGCFFKIIRFDKSDHFVTKTVDFIKNNIPAETIVFGYSIDSSRLSFLSQHEIKALPDLDLLDNPLDEEKLHEVFQSYFFAFPEVWIITREETKAVPLDKVFRKKNVKIELKKSIFANRQKKRQIRFYKIQSEVRSQMNLHSIAEKSKITQNGNDFEKSWDLNSVFYRNMQKELKRLSVPEIIPANKSIPYNWSILNTGLIYPGTKIFMDNKTAIAGKYSLKIVSGKKTVTFYEFCRRKAGKWKISFLAKGSSGCEIVLGCHLYKQNDSHQQTRQMGIVKLPDERLYKIDIEIPEDVFYPHPFFRCYFLISSGWCVLDNFQCVAR